MSSPAFEDSNKWQVPTIIILVVTLLMYAFTGAVFGMVFGKVFTSLNWMSCMLFMLVLGVIVCLFACFPNVNHALKVYSAMQVSESEEPRLHRIVEKIANRAGMPKPIVCVSGQPMMNAFALGTSPDKALVCATDS